MLKLIFKHNFCLIFALIFIVAIFIVSGIVGKSNKYEEILENGIEVEAEVIPNSKYSTMSSNGIDYYCVRFVYLDQNGVERLGTTSMTYNYAEADMMEKNKYIMIKYDPSTYETVEASYRPSADIGLKISKILLAVFIVVDLAMWGVAIYTIIRNFQRDKVVKYGNEYKAMITNMSSSMKVNGVSRYRVHYSWTNEQGIHMSDKTPQEYTLQEANSLVTIKEVTIKALGKYSTLLTKPNIYSLNDNSSKQADNTTLLDNANNNTNEGHSEQSTCEYCGEKISSTSEYCPNCGAKVIKR